ncbi:MAG TPA: L,D-transpeptidase family protein [Acidimicrobiia bacterium]|nr:L,D-transpeptidase family protein [Acidimicrobiia bacterium]
MACCIDAAAEGVLGVGHDDPPNSAALGAVPVAATPPAPLPTTSFPTYEPIPHLAPAPPKVPEPVVATSALEPQPGAAEPEPSPVAMAGSTPTPSNPSPPATTPAVPTGVVARVVGKAISLWNSPTDPRPSFALLGTTEFSTPRVFLVTAHEGPWVKVRLSLPPNGSEAWIRASDVVLSDVWDRIDVDLGARRLRWTRNGDVLLDAPVAVGAPSSPTPAHTYYVTDVLPEDPAGPYGSWVVALNGYSESFTTFDGGLPRLAIHGTNAPSSIGDAVSNGCVRAGASDLAVLAAGVAIGTPVFVS